MRDEDVAEHRQDALGPLLAICIAGWLAALVATLLYHDVTDTAGHPLPLAATLAALGVAAASARRGRHVLAARVLVGGLLAGPALFGLVNGTQSAALFFFLFPIVAAHVLLPAAATGRVTLLALALLVLVVLAGPPVPTLADRLAALWLALPAAATCLALGVILYYDAVSIEALVLWAMDSQRKDARRAELFRLQQEQLRHTNQQLEQANDQLQLLNLQLSEARRVAEVANQLKTRFLANVSHELRAPLHVILALADTTLAGSPPPAIKRDLEHIRTSGRHLNRLIDDLLDLSRAEINALELYPETLDVRAVLADVFHGMHGGHDAAGAVQWRLDLPERLPLLHADGVRLRQILFNLLNNAAKWTEQGSITLAAAAEPPYLHLWVADTGSGIALDQQGRIFEPFGAEHRRGRPAGVGLGLSITRHLVALHHGLLTLESQPGAGSTFHVYLPLPDLRGQPAHPSIAAAPFLVLLSTQVQLAPEVAAIAARQRLPLRRPQTAAELATLLETGEPGGIIWDLKHSAPEHWQIVQAIRAVPALSGLPLLLFGQEGADLSLGVAEFLLKPLSEPGLAQRIKALHAAENVGPLLVVDDDPRARDVYRALLARLLPQYSVLEAEDGAQALDLLANERPSLIILDLTMPGVDGFAVLDEVRAHPATRRTPVLVLSGRLLSQADVQRLQYAHVAFQSKDILRPDEFAAQAARLLEGEQLAAPTALLVKQAITYMHQHYDQAFSRQQMAAYVGVSERYLTEIFHQETGLSPWEYLNRLRVALACRELRDGDESIAEIAARVGFEDARYFARVFRRVMGVAPSAYREAPTAASQP